MKLNDSQRLQKQVEGSASSGEWSGCALPYCGVKTKEIIRFFPKYHLFRKSYTQSRQLLFWLLIFMLHGSNKNEQYCKYSRNSTYMQSQHQEKCIIL